MRDARGSVLYVGRSVDLRARVRSYWGDLGDRSHLRAMVERVAKVDCVTCETEHAAALLEKQLIEQLRPPYNRDYGSASSVWMRLVSDPARPQLDVVFDTPVRDHTEYYGPFLGWRQASLAVRGILQVHPLPYAALRLDGVARDLARVRGVGPDDLEELWGRVAAVLGGDARALRACVRRLRLLRDRAVSSAAFEDAEEIQQRIDAVEWLGEALVDG